MGRKKIRDRTKLCSALLALGTIPYDDAKLMTEDQFLSLWHFDHNILHSAHHPDGDKYWNLTPMLIKAHRRKSREDAKIVAKSRRIRAWNDSNWERGGGLPLPDAAGRAPTLRTGSDEADRVSWRHKTRSLSGPKIRSRGFDKRFRRKMDGTIVKRER